MEQSFISYQLPRLSNIEQLDALQHLYAQLNTRRSTRFFSDEAIDQKVLAQLVHIAGTAPSGAHKQPWTFCIVQDAAIKKQIRIAAEEEEKISYESRMSKEWLDDLAPLGTNWEKPFLEIAPALIIVFRKAFEFDADGAKHQNYYVQESVGIACGMLLTAIRTAGLCSLTHTPSPMNFLCEILKRPANEKPYLLIPVGYAAKDCVVPNLERKSLEEISEWY
jgi:iodotyrosine deiodinase